MWFPRMLRSIWSSITLHVIFAINKSASKSLTVKLIEQNGSDRGFQNPTSWRTRVKTLNTFVYYFFLQKKCANKDVFLYVLGVKYKYGENYEKIRINWLWRPQYWITSIVHNTGIQILYQYCIPVLYQYCDLVILYEINTLGMNINVCFKENSLET